MFAVAILRKELTKIQWISLVLLITGVSLVQIQEQSSGDSATKKPVDQDPMLGLIAVLSVCLMSGFAGIYFEKVLKSTPHVSVWMQNVRLAMLSIPVAFITMRLKDGNAIREKGMFFAYDELVWTIVFGYALGGLLVAMCIRYADNILKGFSQSFAVVFACVGSVFLFNFVPTWLFLVGSSLVVVSVYLYSRFPAPSGLPPTQSTVLFSK